MEGAGGSLLDDASEIEAGVASVMKNLDRNEDRALSRSDLNTYWDRLGSCKGGKVDLVATAAARMGEGG